MNQEKCKNGECNMLDGHNHISCIYCHTSPKEEISKCCGDIALKQVGGLYGCRKCESYCEIVNDWESKLKPKVTIFREDDKRVKEIALSILNEYLEELKPEIKSLLSSTEKRVAKEIVGEIEKEILPKYHDTTYPPDVELPIRDIINLIKSKYE